MDAVKNLYLRKCPLKEGKKDLKKILGINMWMKDTNTFKREFPINQVPSSSYSDERCHCNISCKLTTSLFLEGSPTHTLTPEKREKYVCGLKVWHNPEVAKKLENYFKSRNMIVETFDSDV